MSYPRFRAALGFLAFSVVLVYATRLAASERPAADRPQPPLDAQRIQKLVDEFRGKLAIPQDVTVALVEHNPLMASVTRDQERRGAFVLSLERAFAQTLSGDELRAVLAHELGHVWIFTHHPYLQTESLANHIAMRLVDRTQLEQVYVKVGQHGGERGTVARFMGPASTTPATTAAVAGVDPQPIRVVASPQQQ